MNPTRSLCRVLVIKCLAILSTKADLSLAHAIEARLLKADFDVRCWRQDTITEAELVAFDAAILILSEPAFEDAALETLIARFDYNDIDIYPLSVDGLEPSERVRFYVGVAQWLAIDPTLFEADMDRLAAAIEANKPFKSSRSLAQKRTLGRNAVISALASLAIVIGTGLALLYNSNQVAKRLEAEAAALTERELRPASLPHISLSSSGAAAYLDDPNAYVIMENYTGRLEPFMFQIFDEAVDAMTLVGTSRDAPDLEGGVLNLSIAVTQIPQSGVFCMLYSRSLSSGTLRKQFAIGSITDTGAVGELTSYGIAQPGAGCQAYLPKEIDPQSLVRVTNAHLLDDIYETRAFQIVRDFNVTRSGEIDVDTLKVGAQLTQPTDTKTYLFSGTTDVYQPLALWGSDGGYDFRLTTPPAGLLVCAQTTLSDPPRGFVASSLVLSDFDPVTFQYRSKQRHSPVASATKGGCQALNPDALPFPYDATIAPDLALLPKGENGLGRPIERSRLGGFRLEMSFGDATAIARDRYGPSIGFAQGQAGSYALSSMRHSYPALHTLIDPNQLRVFRDQSTDTTLILLADKTLTWLSGVWAVIRPNYRSVKKRAGLRLIDLRTTLTDAFGPPTDLRLSGDDSTVMAQQKYIWGGQFDKVCNKNTPNPYGSRPQGTAGYSLGRKEAPSCVPHIGASYVRNGDNLTVTIWLHAHE